MSLKLALTLDDLRTVRFPPEYKVIHARTVVAAGVVLERRPVDVLILDHDLGCDEAKRLVTFIESRAAQGRPFQIGAVNIISSNPRAYQEFVALRRWGYEVTIGLGSLPGWLDEDETAFWTEVAQQIDEAARPFGASIA